MTLLSKVRELTTVMRPINALVPYERNSRTHSPEQIKLIAASMMEYGWTSPCLIDENDNILAGHGRTEAAKTLRMPEVPCIVLRGLSDVQKRALVIADNSIALKAGWDSEMLAMELGALAEDGFDLNLVGYDENSLKALLADFDRNPLEDISDDVEANPNAVTFRIACHKDHKSVLMEEIRAILGDFDGAEILA